MAAPTSAVAICNLSLDLLKQQPVADIEAGTQKAEVICGRWYDQTRREVLRKHPWNFAIKRDSLTKDATAPAFGWEQAYNLPNDFLRLVTIGDDSIGNIQDRYELESGQILASDLDSTTANTINIRYIFDVVAVTAFDSLFIKMLVVQLAINMGPKFSISSAIIKALKDELREIGPWATAVDGQERTPKRVERSRLLSARRGRGARGNVAGPFTVFR